MTSDAWRDLCNQQISQASRVIIESPDLGFTDLRRFYSILNLVLYEREAVARLSTEQKWHKPPLLPPYQQPPHISKSKNYHPNERHNT